MFWKRKHPSREEELEQSVEWLVEALELERKPGVTAHILGQVYALEQRIERIEQALAAGLGAEAGFVSDERGS